jgi:hypothetical protein
MYLKLGQTVFAAALLTAVLTFSASAGHEHGQNRDWQGEDRQGEDQGGHTRVAPGPVAGVGLMPVAVAGGYIWLLRSRRQGKKQPE